MYATQRRIFTVHALDYIDTVSQRTNILTSIPGIPATRVDRIANALLSNISAWKLIYVANPEYDNMFEMFNVTNVFEAKYLRLPLTGFIDITSVDLQVDETEQQLIALDKLPRVNYNFTLN